MRSWLRVAVVVAAVLAAGPVAGEAETTPATAAGDGAATPDDTDIPNHDMGQGGGFERPDDKPADDLKPRAHVVAIVSALGDSIGYQAMNTGLWNGGYNITIPLTDAKLDEAASTIALHTLTQDVPGIGIKIVDAPHDAIVAHGNSARLSNGPLNMIRDDLKAWRESHDVDLIVILMPDEGAIDRHRAAFQSARFFFGMGVSGRDAVLFMRIVVLDGRSGEVLSDMKARAVGRLGGNYPEAVFSHPTPEGNAMLAAEMRNLLKGTVPGLLRNAGL